MPLAMGLGNGAGAPMGFVIAALVLLVFSVGFVTMTPYVPEAGAFFSYVTVGLGERMGKGIAVVALIAYTAIQIGIYGLSAGPSTTPSRTSTDRSSRGRCTRSSCWPSSRCSATGTSS